jgi:signal peptidase II
LSYRFPLGAGLAFLVVLADQISKHFILRHFLPLPPDLRFLAVTPSLNFVLSMNRGVTFGMFNDGGMANAVVFSVVALAVAGGMLVWLWRVDRVWLAVAIGLVVGGAVGNIVDRARFGGVVDFIDFYIGSWHWYTFNVADSCICVGVAMLLLDSLAARPESPT